MDESSLAVVHKHYPARGGAEIVADELARTFDAPVFTAFANEGTTSEDVDVTELYGDSRLAPIFRKQSRFGWIVRDAYYYARWDREPTLAEYDVLVQSGTSPMWYVPPDDQTVVRYIHSTPRGPFDLLHRHPPGIVARAYSKAARALHYHTIPYADGYVANSELVAKRMRKYWGIPLGEIEVVYPPVDVDQFRGVASTDGGYYLALSRLDSNKGFEAIIDAFRTLEDVELKIAGDGPERDALEARAQGADNISFLGYVDEARKVELMANARAGVYNARNEDFGMVPVEFFAAGTPVIGVRDGFTEHQLVDGVTGHLFDRGDRELREAVERHERDGTDAPPAVLRAIAESCSIERFRTRMRSIVERTHEAAQVDAPRWVPERPLESIEPREPTEREAAADGGA